MERCGLNFLLLKRQGSTLQSYQVLQLCSVGAHLCICTVDFNSASLVQHSSSIPPQVGIIESTTRLISHRPCLVHLWSQWGAYCVCSFSVQRELKSTVYMCTIQTSPYWTELQDIQYMLPAVRGKHVQAFIHTSHILRVQNYFAQACLALFIG